MKLWKSLTLAFAMLFLASVVPVGAAQPQRRQIKLLLSPGSNVDPVEIVKHLGQKCPNVIITHNRQHGASDYLLDARWAGEYRFQIVAHGGDTIYATETTLLSNAVKDVCHFLNTQAPPPVESY